MTEEDRLERIAEAIADGRPVDWEREQDADPRYRNRLEQLAKLEEVGRALTRLVATQEEPQIVPEAHYGKRISHYRLVEKIGEGGMGVVWKAEDSVLNRTVAIKLLPGDLALDEERRRMFLDEARLAASVSHAHIVQVHELGREGDLDFIVMEYVEGQPLKQLLSGRPLPDDKVADWGLQVAEALARAHRKGLIHRDLKPANILVTPDGEVKIVDFGLATLFAPPETIATSTLALDAAESSRTHRQIAGTLPYMSPEQVRGQKLDSRSDIFSFGTVLYEMTTGQRPFTGPSPADVASEILRARPRPLPELQPKVPIDLHRIVDKALAPRPADRYQHAEDMAVDLKRLGRELESGFSPSYEDLQRLKPGRPARRRLPAWVAMGGVLVVAAFAVWGARLLGKRTEKPAQYTLRQLTSNPPEFCVLDGEISPDGKLVAYGDLTGLYLLEIESGARHTLPLPEGCSFSEGLAWFPDGTALLVPVWRKEAETARGSFWSLSLLSRELRKLAEPAEYPGVSPDGSRIAYRGRDPEVEDGIALLVMGAHGEEPRKVRPVQMFAPFAWSPDGTRLAYARHDSVTTVVETCDLQGANTRVLFEDPRFVFRGELLWLTDGRIVYERRGLEPRERGVNLWSVRIDGRAERAAGPPERLTNETGVRLFGLSASADGKRIAPLVLRRLYDVHVAEIRADGSLAKESLRRLTWDDREDSPSDWRRDGSAVIFASDRRGNWDIYEQKLGERVAQPLVAGPADETNAVLSPNGEHLLFKSRGAEAPGKTHLLRIPLSGGASQRLAELRSQGAYFRCAKQPGAPCVLSEPLEEELVFSVLDPTEGVGREIARVRGSEMRAWNVPNTPWSRTKWDLSPDGSRIAVGLRDSIRIIPLAGGGSRSIPIPPRENLYTLAWAADGQSLIASASRVEPGEYVVLRIDLAGHFTTLLNVADNAYHFPRPSPDGRHLALRWSGWDANVWLLETAAIP